MAGKLQGRAISNTANIVSQTITVGNSTSNSVINSTAVVTPSVNVGSNVFVNTSTIHLGNSTVNTVIHTTGFTGNGAGLHGINASSIATGTLDTARLPSTVNVSSAINVGANLNINTSTIFIGNSTVNTTIIAGNVDLQGTQLRVGNVIVNGNQLSVGNVTITDAQISVGNSTSNIVLGSTGVLSGNGSLLTSVNAIALQGNSVSDILIAANTAANTLASAAFTNATSYADTKASAAYSNAIAYSGNAALAYSNATAYASNADNISSGTLNNSRLPATVNVTSVNLTTAINVGANVTANATALKVGNSTVNTVILATGIDTDGTLAAAGLTTLTDVTITGNLTVLGNTSQGTVGTLAVGDSFLVLVANLAATNAPTSNAGITINRGSSANVKFQWDETNDRWTLGNSYVTGNLTVTGDIQVDGNLVVSGTSVTLNVASLAVEDNMIYLNNGSQVTHPDLGFAGNYNDGSYKHAGFFRDATDGIWKVFDGYTPEPDASAFIDTTNNTFRIAHFQANAITGNTFSGNGASLTSINATNITSGTLDTARLPATANITTAVNVGANVIANTTTVFVGNSTVNTNISAATILINGVNVNTAITSNAATAYSNAIAYSGNAALAYSNAVAYAASNSYVNSTFLPLAGGTLTGTLTVKAISSNGSVGTAGQLLASNGTSTYWIDPPASTNVNAQYTWTNTHTFSNTITFGNSTVNTVVTSTSVSIGGNTLTVGTTAYYTSNGFIGLGTSSPNAVIEAVSPATSRIAAGQYSFVFRGENNNERLAVRSNADAVLIAQKFNGTYASPTAVTSGQNLGGFQAGGYTGAGWSRGMQIRGLAAGNWSSTDTPADITFQTVPVGSTSLTDRMTIGANGNVGINTISPTAQFQVNGSARIGANAQRIHLYDDGNAHIHSITLPLWINCDDNAAVNINRQTSGDVVLTNAGSGKVGIGANTPAYKLQVDSVTANATADSVTIQNSGVTSVGHISGLRFRYVTAEPAAIRAVLTNTGTGTGRLGLFVSTDGTGANLTERVSVEANGNVGIGTTSPTISSGYGLHINSGSGHGGLKLQSTGRTFELLSTSSGYFTVYDTTGGADRLSIAANGNVGVGTTTPASRLDVNGTSSLRNGIQFFRVNSASTGLSYYNSTYSAWCTYMAATGVGSCGPHGNFTSPGSGHGVTSWALRNFIENSSGYGFTWETGTSTGNPTVIAGLEASTGNFSVAGTVTANSDERIKKNIRPIENALDIVKAITGVYYEKIDSGEKNVGVIAQQVEKVLPEVVKLGDPNDPDSIKSVAYGNMVGLLIEAIKEQQKQIEELKAKVGL